MSNAKTVIPAVELELGGRTLKVCYDMWAFCLIEEQTGKNAMNGEAFQNVGAKDVVTLLWAGLQKNHPELAIKDVAHMVDLSQLGDVMRTVLTAFGRATKDDSEKAEQDVKNESAPTPPAEM